MNLIDTVLGMALGLPEGELAVRGDDGCALESDGNELDTWEGDLTDVNKVGRKVGFAIEGDRVWNAETGELGRDVREDGKLGRAT